jgi:hypothetical protein
VAAAAVADEAVAAVPPLQRVAVVVVAAVLLPLLRLAGNAVPQLLHRFLRFRRRMHHPLMPTLRTLQMLQRRPLLPEVVAQPRPADSAVVAGEAQLPQPEAVARLRHLPVRQSL